MKKLFIITLILLSISFSIDAAIINVPADQPNIQAGIDAASDGDTVLVASGTYTGPGNSDIQFNGKAISITGSGPENCHLNCTSAEHGFHCHQGELNTTVISGFKITSSSNAGIRCYQSSPEITNCHVENCGSGIRCIYSNASLQNCLLDTPGTGINSSFSTLQIDNCTMTHCTQSGADFYYCKVIMNQCTIADNENDLGGAGIMNYDSYLSMSDCVIENNNLYGSDILYGAGVFSCGNSLHMYHCIVRNNTIHSDPPNYEHGEGAGVFIQSDGGIENCLIVGNHAENGTIGGVYCASTNYITIRNCTITENEGQGLNTGGSRSRIWNCNIWDECGIGVSSEISYCNLLELIEGDGNISLDPLFVSGPYGDYYLSQTSAGQTQQSPCVDAGVSEAANCQIGNETMDQRTTRTDDVTDQGLIDFGFHYSASQSNPTPTPTPDTPPPTLPPEPAIKLQISQNIFEPGDSFVLTALVSNPGPESFTHQPLVIFLDINSNYFWYPMWTGDFGYAVCSYEPGSHLMEIFNFNWPEINETGPEVTIYGALLTPEMDQILGQWDSTVFSWQNG